MIHDPVNVKCECVEIRKSYMRKTSSMSGGSQLLENLKVVQLEKKSSPPSIESHSSVPCSQKLASETCTQSIRTVIKIHFNNILSSTADALECINYLAKRKQIDKLINPSEKIQRIGQT